MAETADICIVGGGIIGCSLAFELARAGRRVVVVESDQGGGKASGEAAGMLTPMAEADGPGAFLDLGLASLAMFPEAEAELKDRTGIDIELLRWGILYLACEEHEAVTIAERLAWLSEAGLPAEHVSADELRSLEPALADDLLGAMLLPQDWPVNNWTMTQAYSGVKRKAVSTSISRSFSTRPRCSNTFSRRGPTWASPSTPLETPARPTSA